MRVTYDEEANAAYIYLVDKIADGEVARTAVSGIPMSMASINVDFDVDGKVLGIEVLGARHALTVGTLGLAEDITRRIQ